MNKNYDIIKEKYAALYDEYIAVKDRSFEDNDIRAYIDTANDGSNIVAFGTDGIYRYVNSRYMPIKAANIWAEMFDNFHPRGILLIFGLGNGIHIREMLKKLSKTNIVIVIEPNIEMFNIVMNEFDISDILADERVFLSVNGISEGVYESILSLFVDYSNYKLVELYYLPNYDKIYYEQFMDAYKKFKSAVELIILDRNTHIGYSHEFIENILKNCRDIVNQYTINELRESFEKSDIADIPAIVVSAGPSLDKNINELKEAVGKSFIIVVDTALKPVLNAGIRPDMTVLVDPHKPLELFNNEKIKDIPMVVSHMANYRIVEKQRAPRIYFGDRTNYMGYIYKEYNNDEIGGLDSGGSVANNAFSLAVYLGFKTIILVGQDLAFSGNKSHASSTYEMKVDKDFMLRHTQEVMVEDIYGNMVSTMKNMELYIRWFEKAIAIHKDIKVIDATEGGAKIKGTIIMPLKQAISDECNKEINISEIISNTRKAFTDSQIEEIYKGFENIPERLKNLKSKVEKGIRDYYKFEELYRKGKTNTSEFAKYVEKITEANSLMDGEELGELIGVYSAKENFDVAEDIFEFKADESEEIKTIVDKGVKLLEAYSKAIDMLQKDLPLLLN